MKKAIAFLLLACIAAGKTLAAEQSDTTIVVEQPKKVVITETRDHRTVRVEGQSGNPSYVLEREYKRFEGDINVTVEKSWGFSLPFSKKAKDSEKVQLNHNIPTFFLGLTTAIGAPSLMDTPIGSGWEIGFHPVEGPIFRLGKHVSLQSDFGFTWRNYRMTGDTRFVKDGSQLLLQPYPAGADINFSRIKTFSITLPLLLDVQRGYYHGMQMKDKHRQPDWWFQIGPVLNVNTYASSKTRYKLDGQKHKDIEKHIHQTPVTVDLYTSFGIGDIGLYFRYSPCHVLRQAYGPKFNALSFGLCINP